MSKFLKSVVSFKYFGQIVFFVAVIAIWQITYMTRIFPEMVFPSVPDIGKALVEGFISDELFGTILYSLKMIGQGLAIGVILAFVLSALSVASKAVHAAYNMVVSIFDLLPGIALVPLAILWFGLGRSSVIFIIIHSVIWPVSRSILDGFQTTPKIYTEFGKNIGLRTGRLVRQIFLPASLPSIISGLKVGWARAWRALISVEMVFGVTGSEAGIGYYIFLKRYKMDITGVYATLVLILLIGAIVEFGVFAQIEKRTIKKWGMVR